MVYWLVGADSDEEVDEVEVDELENDIFGARVLVVLRVWFGWLVCSDVFGLLLETGDRSR